MSFQIGERCYIRAERKILPLSTSIVLFDQTCEWPTRDQMFTNTINETLSENPGARDCVNIHGGRVDVADSINSDKSSYTHVLSISSEHGQWV